MARQPSPASALIGSALPAAHAWVQPWSRPVGAFEVQGHGEDPLVG